MSLAPVSLSRALSRLHAVFEELKDGGTNASVMCSVSSGRRKQGARAFYSAVFVWKRKGSTKSKGHKRAPRAARCKLSGCKTTLPPPIVLVTAFSEAARPFEASWRERHAGAAPRCRARLRPRHSTLHGCISVLPAGPGGRAGECARRRRPPPAPRSTPRILAHLERGRARALRHADDGSAGAVGQQGRGAVAQERHDAARQGQHQSAGTMRVRGGGCSSV